MLSVVSNGKSATDLCISASVASWSLGLRIPEIDDRTVIVAQVSKRNYRYSGRKSRIGQKKDPIRKITGGLRGIERGQA